MLMEDIQDGVICTEIFPSALWDPHTNQAHCNVICIYYSHGFLFIYHRCYSTLTFLPFEYTSYIPHSVLNRKRNIWWRQRWTRYTLKLRQQLSTTNHWIWTHMERIYIQDMIFNQITFWWVFYFVLSFILSCFVLFCLGSHRYFIVYSIMIC